MNRFDKYIKKMKPEEYKRFRAATRELLILVNDFGAGQQMISFQHLVKAINEREKKNK